MNKIMSPVCRACLAGAVSEVKLISLEQPLLDIYEKLAGAGVGTVNALICRLCLSQLQKCHRFSEMARRSETYLNVLFGDAKDKDETFNNMLILMRKLPKKKQLSVKEMSLKEEFVKSFTKRSKNDGTMENELILDDYIKQENQAEMNYMEETSDVNEEDAKDSLKIEKKEEDSGSTDYKCTDKGGSIENKIVLKGFIKKADIEKKECQDDVNPLDVNKTSDVKDENLEQEKKDSTEYKNVNQNSHIENQNFDSNNLSCTICKKDFSHIKKLIRHSLIHNGERPYICEICGHRSRTKTNLKIHFLVHTKEKVYCKICNNSFTQEGSLRKHMLIHAGVFPFTCHYCGKKFNQSSSFLMHIRSVHERMRPCPCEVCNKRFSTNAQLKRHVMAEHEGVKFECDECGIKVTTKSTLVRHKKHSCKKS